MATYLADNADLDKIGKTDPERDQAKAAAAEEIDAAFRSAGYTTPIDTSLITDADIAARFAAKLALTEQAIAYNYLIASDVDRDGEPDFQRKEFERAMAYLGGIRDGSNTPPGGIPRSARTFTVAGDRDEDYSQDVLDIAGHPALSE